MNYQQKYHRKVKFNHNHKILINLNFIRKINKMDFVYANKLKNIAISMV